MDPAIFRVMYWSRAISDFNQSETLSMCADFAQKNAKSDVTGVLLKIGQSFVQVLEGDHDIVEQLLMKIARDNRHREVTVLSRHGDQKRVFGQWSMHLIDLEQETSFDCVKAVEMRKQIAQIVEGSNDMKSSFATILRQVAASVSAG